MDQSPKTAAFMKWFAKAIADLETTTPNTKEDYERVFGVGDRQVRKWREKKVPLNPELKTFLKIMESIRGADISRALPTYVPPRPPGLKDEMVIGIHGRVQAGEFTISEVEQEFITCDTSIWKKGPFTGLTANALPIGLRVKGSSTEPNYYEGDILICKPPNDPVTLTSGIPCIFENHLWKDGSSTFKILRKDNQGRMYGWPLNPKHDLVTMDENTKITYIVIGKIGASRRS